MSLLPSHWGKLLCLDRSTDYIMSKYKQLIKIEDKNTWMYMYNAQIRNRPILLEWGSFFFYSKDCHLSLWYWWLYVVWLYELHEFMLYDTKSQCWIKEIKIWEDSTRTSVESDKIRKNKDRHLKNILVLQKPWSGKKIGASKIDSEACQGSCKWNEKAESSGNTLSSQTQLCLKVMPCKVFVFQFASKH